MQATTCASRYTGKERDTESGLDYFGARYYGSSMGRFQSSDPSGMAFTSLSNPQSFNMYSYVQNNPLINVDPDGLDCVYIGGDGTMTGFNRGDCDNSTTEKANSGYYFDGTVNTIYTTTGDTSGQVVGVQGTTDDGNSLYQSNPAGLSFGQPNSSVSTSGMDTAINTRGDYSQTTQFNHGTHPYRDNNPGDITAGPFTSRNGQIGTEMVGSQCSRVQDQVVRRFIRCSPEGITSTCQSMLRWRSMPPRWKTIRQATSSS
ncbi:MAG: RHS repeat-associated core domain-containing protein [Acidobacteriaceae bacterium]|nr:RHS repeat-associated core domain-containing protein [Acidobacteriaceae bacterium]